MRIGVARKGPWVMSGDFNELADPDEKIGGVRRSHQESIDFVQMLKACGMWEIRHFGYQFFWFGQRNNELVQCRLDRIVANHEWMEMFGNAVVSYLHKVSSDHSPHITCLLEDQRRNCFVFKYDQSLFFKEGFKEKIAKSWHEAREGQVPQIMDLIRNCRKAILGWKRRDTCQIRRLESENSIMR